MSLRRSYEEYHARNPLARYIRKNMPEGYFSRPLMIVALVVMLATSYVWVETQAEPYWECTLPCTNPITGEYYDLPLTGSRFYSEGRPISEQLTEIFTALGLQFVGFMMLNYAYWAYRTRGGRV